MGFMVFEKYTPGVDKRPPKFLPGTSGTGNNGGGGGGGNKGNRSGGGGSGGKGNTGNDDIDNLGAVAGHNIKTTKNVVKAAERNYDQNSEDDEKLLNLNISNSARKTGSDWFRQQQKLAAVKQQLKDSTGNAMSGSSYYDLNDMLALADDDIDTTTIDTHKDNVSAALEDFYQNEETNRSQLNQTYIDAYEAMRNIGADYAAQAAGIDKDDADELFDRKKHKLNLPDFLNVDNYLKNHWKDGIDPKMMDFIRDERSRNKATNAKANQKLTSTTSANNDYWSRMRNGYSRRVR